MDVGSPASLCSFVGAVNQAAQMAEMNQHLRNQSPAGRANNSRRVEAVKEMKPCSCFVQTRVNNVRGSPCASDNSLG